MTGNTAIDVYLDPDNNNVLPTELTLTVTFPFDLVARNGGSGGGLGLNVNPRNMTFDGTLEAYHGDGSQVMFDNSYSFNGTSSPTSYNAGLAVWSGLGATDQITGNGNWHGLTNDNTSPYFTWPSPHATAVPDQSNTLGQMTWTFSDFTGTGDVFRLSFDGGVPAQANVPVDPVPEPTSLVLLGLGFCSCLIRRKRS